MWNTRSAAIEKGGLASIAEAILERWFSRDLRDNDPVALAGWRAMLTRTPQAGYLGTSAALRDADFTEEAKRIEVQTLCMVGAEDGATTDRQSVVTGKSVSIRVELGGSHYLKKTKTTTTHTH